MRRKSAWLIATVLAAGPTLVYGQRIWISKDATGAGPPVDFLATVATTPGSTVDTSSLTARLNSIDTNLKQLAMDKDKPPDHTTAWSPLVGVLIGGAIAFDAQWFLAGRKEKADREAAAVRAELEIASAVTQWQLKQLSELYGPMQALLRESKALYQQMRDVLITQDPSRFRLIQNQRDSARAAHGFEIHLDGKWQDFRSVLHLDEIYGKGYGTDPYMDAIVSCGKLLVKIIQEKAGYLLPDQAGLGVVFGQYLAHFSVLDAIYAYCAAPTASPRSRPPVTTNAAKFPDEINKWVSNGFEQISAALRNWQTKAGSSKAAVASVKL